MAKECGMDGGFPNEIRELYVRDRDGWWGHFEQDLNETFGERLRSGDKDLGQQLWQALSDIIWYHKSMKDDDSYYGINYSFRAAGDLIAALCQNGDYLDWYCCAPSETVNSAIAQTLSKLGWTFKYYKNCHLKEIDI